MSNLRCADKDWFQALKQDLHDGNSRDNKEAQKGIIRQKGAGVVVQCVWSCFGFAERRMLFSMHDIVEICYTL